MRAHFDEVVKRLPSAATADAPLVLSLTLPFTYACEAVTRDEIVAYLKQHFGSIATLARPLQQGIERMDNCIARKKLLEPSLRAWLTAEGVKPRRVPARVTLPSSAKASKTRSRLRSRAGK